MTYNQHWKMTTGVLVGALIIIAGIVLQLFLGAIDWSAFAWPVNGITLLVFSVLILVAHFLCLRGFRPFLFLRTLHAAVPALCYAVVLTVIMGLTRQDGNSGWLSDMLTFWPFALIYAYIAFILGLITLKRLHLIFFRHTASRHLLLDMAFVLNHAGLFLVIVCATLGNADIRRLKMVTATHMLQWRAVDERMRVMDMPIAVELKRFIMEEYDDGTPRRFASDIEVVTRTGKDFLATVDVNHPVKVDGWKIYQYDYDADLGAASQTSVLEFVRDPWLPSVYVGIYMLLAGALLMFLGSGSRNDE